MATASYGTAIGIWEHPNVRILFEGLSSPISRTDAAIGILNELMPTIAHNHARGALLIQYDDYAHNNMSSLGFGKRKDESPAVKLIPDPFFLRSHGYQKLRGSVDTDMLLPWDVRQDIVFWRGSATTRHVSSTGEIVEELHQIPRVDLCLKLRDDEKADVAISQPWGFQFNSDMAIQWFKEERIYRPAVPILSQGQCRYLIDIDGVANAWGFFEKLLLGSCILKVMSDYEQWFYSSITAWSHFVPVSADLSDLTEKIAWCRENVEKAAEIGTRGQAFALAHDFATAQAFMIEAGRSRFIPY